MDRNEEVSAESVADVASLLKLDEYIRVSGHQHLVSTDAELMLQLPGNLQRDVLLRSVLGVSRVYSTRVVTPVPSVNADASHVWWDGSDYTAAIALRTVTGKVALKFVTVSPSYRL